MNFSPEPLIKNTCNLFVLGEMEAGILESPHIIPKEKRTLDDDLMKG